LKIAMRIHLEDIRPHHAALFLGPAAGDPGGTLAILIVLLLLLLSAAALLFLGIASLAWLLRPSGKKVDVLPLQTGKDVFWIPMPKGERCRGRLTKTTPRSEPLRGSSEDLTGSLQGRKGRERPRTE